MSNIKVNRNSVERKTYDKHFNNNNKTQNLMLNKTKDEFKSSLNPKSDQINIKISDKTVSIQNLIFDDRKESDVTMMDYFFMNQQRNSQSGHVK